MKVTHKEFMKEWMKALKDSTNLVIYIISLWLGFVLVSNCMGELALLYTFISVFGDIILSQFIIDNSYNYMVKFGYLPIKK